VLLGERERALDIKASCAKVTQSLSALCDSEQGEVIVHGVCQVPAINGKSAYTFRWAQGFVEIEKTDFSFHRTGFKEMAEASCQCYDCVMLFVCDDRRDFSG